VTYSGDANFTSSGSNAQSVAVSRNTTSTGLLIFNSSPTVGQAVTLAATVTPAQPGTLPTGSVEFYDNGNATCSASLTPAGSSATASCAITYASAGAHSITVNYGGDSNFTGSSPAAQTITVQAAPARTSSPAISATTLHATHITRTSARLTGTVNPDDVAVAWQFQYGRGRVYDKATHVQSITAGHGATPVSATVTGLAPAKTYHVELVTFGQGSGQSLAAFGRDVTFTTQPIGRLSLGHGKLTETKGAVSVAVRCLSTQRCQGRISLAGLPKGGKASSTTSIACGVASYRISARAVHAVVVKVARRCADLLKTGRHRLATRVAAVPATAQLPVTNTVTMALP
jgi:hypothetical protein